VFQQVENGDQKRKHEASVPKIDTTLGGDERIEKNELE
tara:strand:+ start:109 stop:222 length:114 start_codon:yes stop_codon:yes gene_type:complete